MTYLSFRGACSITPPILRFHEYFRSSPLLQISIFNDSYLRISKKQKTTLFFRIINKFKVSKRQTISKSTFQVSTFLSYISYFEVLTNQFSTFQQFKILLLETEPPFWTNHLLGEPSSRSVGIQVVQVSGRVIKLIMKSVVSRVSCFALFEQPKGRH